MELNDNEVKLAITFAENLKNENKRLRDGVRSAKHLIKRHQKHVASFKALLNPSAKAGHTEALRSALSDAEWALQLKQNEVVSFRDNIKDNNTFISIIKHVLKNSA